VIPLMLFPERDSVSAQKWVDETDVVSK